MKYSCWLKQTAIATVLIFAMASANAFSRSVAVVQPQVDYKTLMTERQVVDQLIAEALLAFKSPARDTNAGFTGKLQSNMEIVAERLLQAAELEPYRADLLFSAASAYIYNKEVDKAIALYQRILTLAPDDIDAHTYLAAWYRYQGKTELSKQHQATVEKLNLGTGLKIGSVFAVIDKVAKMPLSDRLAKEIAASFTEPTAIVTLGYVLNPDGSMNEILINRLEKTLELAKQLPHAMLVVTGGVPKNNQTEARLMADWLVAKGISATRIYQDNFARSTVENALFSRYALSKHNIKNVVIISSGSHVRRSEAMFTIAAFDTGPREVNYVAVAALDKPLAELQTTSNSDLQGIYRDALKAMGLWSFRSYPLEER